MSIEIFNKESKSFSHDYLKVWQKSNGDLILKMSYLPTGNIAFGTSFIKLKMSSTEFSEFKRCLREGIQKRHGKSGVLLSQKITTLAQNHQSSYRDVRVYFRLLILSIVVKPAAISSNVVSWLCEVEV